MHNLLFWSICRFYFWFCREKYNDQSDRHHPFLCLSFWLLMEVMDKLTKRLLTIFDQRLQHVWANWILWVPGRQNVYTFVIISLQENNSLIFSYQLLNKPSFFLLFNSLRHELTIHWNKTCLQYRYMYHTSSC